MSAIHHRVAKRLGGPGMYPGIPPRAWKRAWNITPRKARAKLLASWQRVLQRKGRFSPLAVATYLRLGFKYQEAERVSVEAARPAAPQPRA